jgi:hypothetical protein
VVVRSYPLTEVGDDTIPLMKHDDESRARGVAIDDEPLVEVRHLKECRCHHRPFEELECLLRLVQPLECLTFEEGGERGSHHTISCDELAVVLREPQEISQRL